MNAQLDPADPLDVWSDDAITQERVAEPEQTAEDGRDAIVVDDAEVVGDIAESSQAAAVPPAPKDAEPVAPDAGQDHSEVSEQAVQTDPKPATDTATAETLSDKIAALETLIAGQNEQWEPDDAGTDPYAGTDAPSMAWEDAETAEIPPEEEAVHDIYEADPEPGPEPEAQIFASDEDVLDEDALRDLVADIVREELQGALGERITRNVRKLVRREIHRAFAAQDLE